MELAVHLEATTSIHSDLVPGDWVMLSGSGGAVGDLPAHHRWYRVVGLDGQPERQELLVNPKFGDIECYLMDPIAIFQITGPLTFRHLGFRCRLCDGDYFETY